MFTTLFALLPSDSFAAGSPLESETFANNSTAAGQWMLPAGRGNTNGACLTAGPVSATTSVPNCSPTTDASGSGALRMTTNAASAVGAVFYQASLPTAQGLDVTLDTYQFDGTGADGIVFSLAAADPANPTPPASTGPLGGDLGYAANTQSLPGTAGMPYGYLGIGLDVYGNYENTPLAGGTGCTIPSPLKVNTAYPESVTARGPGNGNVGYCILATTATVSANSSGGGSHNGTITNVGAGNLLDNQTATTRTGDRVPIEIAINPSGSATTTTSGLSVPAMSWLIAYTPLGTATQQTLSGALPTTTNNAALSTFPASWIDPATGIPYQLTFGWTASTGGSNEYHEVNQVTAATLIGAVPELSLTKSDDESGRMLAGNQANFILAPSVSSSGGSEFEHAHRQRRAARRDDPGHRHQQRRLGVRDGRPDRDLHVHPGLRAAGGDVVAQHHDPGDPVVRVERQRDQHRASLIDRRASRGEQRHGRGERLHRHRVAVVADVPSDGHLHRDIAFQRNRNRHLQHRRHDALHRHAARVELHGDQRPGRHRHGDGDVLR